MLGRGPRDEGWVSSPGSGRLGDGPHDSRYSEVWAMVGACLSDHDPTLEAPSKAHTDCSYAIPVSRSGCSIVAAFSPGERMRVSLRISTGDEDEDARLYGPLAYYEPTISREFGE